MNKFFYYYFTNSSIGTPNALAILATVWTLGLITTLLSINFHAEGVGFEPTSP